MTGWPVYKMEYLSAAGGTPRTVPKTPARIGSVSAQDSDVLETPARKHKRIGSSSTAAGPKGPSTVAKTKRSKPTAELVRDTRYN